MDFAITAVNAFDSHRMYDKSCALPTTYTYDIRWHVIVLFMQIDSFSALNLFYDNFFFFFDQRKCWNFRCDGNHMEKGETQSANLKALNKQTEHKYGLKTMNEVLTK